ncbi:hypothetical protein POX_d05239 [Penicillium oxalicum]|uniref:Uncharacterized protein n=1 Tax=Penicillium oxalicum (strain 114-2 / CGMCC 5302) TaxID=933388 RepID=S7ZV15_PENO1|nr:hypothetical protein POX_d05239 [Penicillium oxalicum]EPS32601.1 hypothetical protein PDE_07561 [Penicillium oxalicum 114-2]KAI2789742.1 hypothetical protein POX_d05239 [Penicillium oxalicum]
MDAQPLTRSTFPRSKSAGSDTDRHEPTTDHSNDQPQVRRSWSLKRLLSGRKRRPYAVLEREPNRLRKRPDTND